MLCGWSGWRRIPLGTRLHLLWPWSDGTTGITLSPFEFLEKLAALVPLPRVHLVRYAGCFAPHSALREAIIPTSRQQGVEGTGGQQASLPWSWARLLKRVFALELARCPFCQRGALQIIPPITPGEVVGEVAPPSETCCSPTSHRTCPVSPRNVRLGRLNPRRRATSCCGPLGVLPQGRCQKTV